MQSLADRFHDLVCLKLIHHNKNKVKRRTNSRLEPEDISDGEEARSSGNKIQNDVSVLQNVAGDRHNNFVYHPTPGTSSAPSEDIRPLSIDQESTQPIAVAPAPYLNGDSSMGKTPSKLIAGELEFPNIKLKEHMAKQQERTNRTNSRQLDTNSAGLETLPFQARMESASDSQSPPRFVDQNRRSPILTTHNTKRLLPDDARRRIAKKSKKDSDVQTVRPSLIVVLKLTRGKGVSNRQTTMPPQQSCIPIPFAEDDEISIKHPSVPASHPDVVASDPEIGVEQTSVQSVEPMNDISEVVMDNSHDLNDLTFAPDATDATRLSSTMPDQPHVTPIQIESHAIAEFYRLWSGEASELVRAMLTTSLSKHTPENLLFDILLPVLRDTHDHCQKGRTALQQSIEPSDTASQEQSTRNMSLLNRTGGIYVSYSAPGGENFNVPVQPTGSQHSSALSEIQADPRAEVDSDAHQPCPVIQDSEALEIEIRQAATSTPLTGNEIHEPGLQKLATKLETTTSPTDKDSNSLRSVFFRLYLDEDADPLEPQCCVKLTGLTTRDELFTMLHDDLQDDLDTGDQIVVVKVKRADGEVFRGPNVRIMPIKKAGQQDMWRELIDTLLEHGAGEEGLMGYVKVKKSIDAK